MHMHTRLPTRATNHVWIVVHVCMCARARAREQEDLSVGSKKTSVFKEQEDLSVYVAAKTSSLFPLRPPPPPPLPPSLPPSIPRCAPWTLQRTWTLLGHGSATSTMPPAGKRPGSSGRGSGGASVAPPSSNLTTPGPSRPTSKGGRVHKGNALSWNELVSSERAKVAAMLSQVCVCVCVFDTRPGA